MTRGFIVCLALAITTTSTAASWAQESVVRGASKRQSSLIQTAIERAQPAMVKIFGASAGRVDGTTTGFFVSADGKILTAQGVYLNGRRIQVITADGTQHNATVLKRDRRKQLALLKISAPSPDFFQLTNQSNTQAGDWVIAICNAFKVADKDEPISATLGVVSLRTRMEAKLNRRDYAYAGDLILIDAITSNPGAAGGAVINTAGEIVGMVGKIIDSSETNTRLNYAVPQETLYRFVAGTDNHNDASESSKPTTSKPGDVGIFIFRLGGKNSPAYVDRVRRNSAAAKVKIKPDDLIISIDGQNIGNVNDYDAATKNLVAGEEVLFILKRGSKVIRQPITPTAITPKGKR